MKEARKIQIKYDVSEKDFIQGFIFADHIASGVKALLAYKIAYQVDEEKARRKSRAKTRIDWIEELILFLQPNSKTSFISHRQAIIQKQMNIIQHGEDRDSISAAKAIAPYIGVGIEEKEVEDASAKSIELLKTFIDGISKLGKAGKMIGREGEIIDVTEIK